MTQLPVSCILNPFCRRLRFVISALQTYFDGYKCRQVIMPADPKNICIYAAVSAIPKPLSTRIALVAGVGIGVGERPAIRQLILS